MLSPHQKAIPPLTKPAQIRLKLEQFPQELYDEITTLTLGPISGTHHIGLSYLPPAALSLNRSHRKSFSEAYYSNASVFKFHNSATGIVTFGRWVASLSQEALELLEGQYGTKDQGTLDEAVDLQLEIAGGRRLRVWCENVDQKWIEVLKVSVWED